MINHQKIFRSDSIDNKSNECNEKIEISNKPIDYLSLKPERIVSITRSRLPNQQHEFLLKCTLCPKTLFFISNEKAKELIPDLLIEFYERHINWFINKPSRQKRHSNSTNRTNKK